jgi:AmiR/NasT family two-component response regulator
LQKVEKRRKKEEKKLPGNRRYRRNYLSRKRLHRSEHVAGVTGSSPVAPTDRKKGERRAVGHSSDFLDSILSLFYNDICINSNMSKRESAPGLGASAPGGLFLSRRVMANRHASPEFESDAESASILAPPLAALRIVAADADLWMRLFYQELLPRMGHEATVVESGHQLVKLCSAVQPDLILTAVHLTELDGLDAAEQLSRERLAPIVLVCDQQTPELLARAAQAECVLGFLHKPITERELAPAIAVAVGRFRQLRELHRLALERSEEIALLRQTLEECETGRPCSSRVAV